MQGMMKKKPGPTAPPWYHINKAMKEIWQYLTFYLLQSSKPEDDGSLILRDDADAEEDGEREREDDEDDREGYQ